METTHYSVVDSEGNAVAVTYTLNGGFGNGITVPGLGFLLNNEMDDFSAKPGTPNMFGLVQGENNAIAAGQAAAVVDDADDRAEGRQAVHDRRRAGRLAHLDRGAAGDPERDRLRHERAGCDRLRRAFHHQWQPDKLSLERGISPDTVALLKSRGYDVDYAPGVVLAQVAAIVSDGGWLQGGSGRPLCYGESGRYG